MITAIKDSNVEAYKLLFEEASDILSGYERVQTFDADKKYYYKNSLTKEFIEVTFASIEEFANGLVEYVVLYTPILNPDGTEKGAVENFSSQIGITTLEEYYNWLPDLKRDVNGNPTKYTILPLDEPHFEINANTRAINIPNEFKKNGIAVQGDDLAEIVYFKVDRYFDAMDLNNTEIYIEWETPKDKTHEAVKSVSDIYIRDIESEPGKLIFGWAISDALTAAAGNLKFSVKFLQWAENPDGGKKTMVYALNTLTATIAIHQSIGLDVNTDYENIDNANDRLLERIEPGVVVGGIQAETPYFLENLDSNYEYDIVPNHTDGTLKIYAVATAADTGSVTYVWKRKDLDVDNIAGLSELEIPNSSTTEMVLVPIGEDGYPIFVEKHAYYYGDNYIPFTGTIDSLKTQYPDPDTAPVFYEKKAVLTVDNYGVYTVEARNRIFNSMSKKKSESAIFKRPDAIGIDNSAQTKENHIIGEVSATLDPVFDMDAIGDINYQWTKSNDDITFEAFEEIVEDVDKAQQKAYTATTPGYYQVVITRTRNRAAIDEKSLSYRVTYAPEVPQFVDGTWDAATFIEMKDLLEGTKSLEVVMKDDIDFDEYYVTWSMYRGDKNMEDLPIVTQKISSLISTFNPVDGMYKEIFKAAGEDYEGLYYATVANKLNGVISNSTEIPSNTAMFVVTGQQE